jgi:hypothetical protein
MNSKYLPKNSVSLVVSLDDEGLPVVDAYSNLTDEQTEDENTFLALLLKGLEFNAYAGGNLLASIGNIMAILDKYEESDLVFEPDEELVEKLQDAKIIPINGKHRPN